MNSAVVDKPTYDSFNVMLRAWGQLGRESDRSRAAEGKRWDAASRMIAAAKPLLKACAVKLDALLCTSDSLLEPLGDPLRTDYGAHRWLSRDREESYSDWLAWIVQNLKSHEVVRLFANHETIPRKILEVVQPTVDREVWVPKSHPDGHGRLDIVIRFGDRAVIVVETKVGHADESDTAKQRHYSAWLKNERGKKYSVLLATDGDELNYHGFQLLKWEDLCLSLRHLSKNLIASHQIGLAAMALAFVGAVEQNLLGLSIPAAEGVVDGQFATFNPKVFYHLDRWVNGREDS
jgi:hypothetical protein